MTVFQLESKESLAEIVNFNHKIFSGMYPWEPYNLKQYQERLSGEKPRIITARDNGNLVGDIISLNQETQMYIWILGVDEQYREKGIGTQLLKRVETEARINMLDKVTTKVYQISYEMIRLLTTRYYEVEKVQKAENPFYDALMYKLPL